MGPPPVALPNIATPARGLRLTRLGWVVAGLLAALGGAAVWNASRGRPAGVGGAVSTLSSATSATVGGITGAASSVASGATSAVGAAVDVVASAAGAVAEAAASVVKPSTFNTGAIALAPRPKDTLLSAAVKSGKGEPMGAVLPPGPSFATNAFSALPAAFGAGGGFADAPVIRYAPARFNSVKLPGPRRALNLDPRGPPEAEPDATQPPCQLSDFAPTRPIAELPIASLRLGPA